MDALGEKKKKRGMVCLGDFSFLLARGWREEGRCTN